MGIFDHIWSDTMICAQIWSSMIIYDHIWSYMIIYDHIWLYMIIYAHIWSYMIMYDYILGLKCPFSKFVCKCLFCGSFHVNKWVTAIYKIRKSYTKHLLKETIEHYMAMAQIPHYEKRPQERNWWRCLDTCRFQQNTT